jgi:uncharacterized protein
LTTTTAYRVVGDDYGPPYWQQGRVRFGWGRWFLSVPGTEIAHPAATHPYDAKVAGVWCWKTLQDAIECSRSRRGRVVELAYDPDDVLDSEAEAGRGLVLRRCKVVRELDDLEQLLELASQCALRDSSGTIHGRDHWERVGRVGEELAAATAGADARVVRVFAAFHDSQRMHDGKDREHGARAAEVVRQLKRKIHLSREQLETVSAALADHDRGLVSDDPTIGCAWDADRIDLVRLGMRPRAELLSTLAAKERVAGAG